MGETERGDGEIQWLWLFCGCYGDFNGSLSGGFCGGFCYFSGDFCDCSCGLSGACVVLCC